MIYFSIFLQNCSQKQQQSPYTPPKPSNLSGEELAKTYCGSCHLYPSPQLLDKKTWQEGVLPQMKLRLGLGDQFNRMMGMESEEMIEILAANIYPENPVIAEEDWKKITDFYIEQAPEKSILQEKKTILVQNNLFKIHAAFEEKDQLPLTTLVKFNQSEKTIYVGNRRNMIEVFGLELKKKDSVLVESPPSDIVFFEGKRQILTMGIMDPNDQRKGKFQINGKTILDSLRRPVQASFADLNQDKKNDMVLCSYGNEIGKLAWYEAETMKEHILKPISGARNAIITDLNKDGLPDIVALMAQSREGIFIFYNKGKGEFAEEIALEFPSVYGSSFIELADFNQDGFQDILYTNGDNADYSYSLKAYHGIRIFLNDTKNHFKQSFFYPFFGASKAQAADFDSDGDLDIAAISFFPEKPSEGFVFLENQGKNDFKATTIKEANQGNWLVMDVADMDTDGDKDIVLGSFVRSKPEKRKGKFPKILILENRKR